MEFEGIILQTHRFLWLILYEGGRGLEQRRGVASVSMTFFWECYRKKKAESHCSWVRIGCQVNLERVSNFHFKNKTTVRYCH